MNFDEVMNGEGKWFKRKSWPERAAFCSPYIRSTYEWPTNANEAVFKRNGFYLTLEDMCAEDWIEITKGE